MEDQHVRPRPKPSGTPKKQSKKESCWNCYKLYIPTDETNRLKNAEKCFCSDFCNKKYSL